MLGYLPFIQCNCSFCKLLYIYVFIFIFHRYSYDIVIVNLFGRDNYGVKISYCGSPGELEQANQVERCFKQHSLACWLTHKAGQDIFIGIKLKQSVHSVACSDSFQLGGGLRAVTVFTSVQQHCSAETGAHVALMCNVQFFSYERAIKCHFVVAFTLSYVYFFLFLSPRVKWGIHNHQLHHYQREGKWLC